MSPSLRFAGFLFAAALIGACAALLLSSGGGPDRPEPVDPVGRTAW